MTSNQETAHLRFVDDGPLCCAIDVQPGINNLLPCSLAVHDDDQPHLALGDDGLILSTWTMPRRTPAASDHGYAVSA